MAQENMEQEQNLKELGMLVVIVLKAKNLIDKHHFSKVCNSWISNSAALRATSVAVKLPHSPEVKTEIDKRGGQAPVWDHQFNIPILEATKGEEQKLRIRIYAHEKGPDELLGEGEVMLQPRHEKEWENNEFDAGQGRRRMAHGGRALAKSCFKQRGYLSSRMENKSTPQPQQAQHQASLPSGMVSAGLFKKPSAQPTFANLPPQELKEAQRLNPIAFNLQRRPSKLDPKTRLGRANLISGPTGEEAESKALPPRGSSIQPWPDQSVNTQRPTPVAKTNGKALPLPGDPEPPEIPAWLQPALGQSASLPRAKPHSPADTQEPSLYDDLRWGQEQSSNEQPAPRVETPQWSSQGQSAAQIPQQPSQDDSRWGQDQNPHQQPAPRIETSQWSPQGPPLQQQERQPPWQEQEYNLQYQPSPSQPSPTPVQQLPGAFPFGGPTSPNHYSPNHPPYPLVHTPSSYSSVPTAPYYSPVPVAQQNAPPQYPPSTNVYGTVPYPPPTPVSGPMYDPRYQPTPQPQFQHHYSAPNVLPQT
ncbi:hypothetical protein P7C70_g5674, partial [Phenoliferia sp. Uapishka_3]